MNDRRKSRSLKGIEILHQPLMLLIHLVKHLRKLKQLPGQTRFVQCQRISLPK